jgi:SAM-dependent methyltransferase
MSLADWETLYRWEWFRREAWRPTFRHEKRGKFGGSCACVKEIADGFGPGARVLDASCGFGLKTIVLKEMGVKVVGSDGCAFAVEKAKELARLEQLDIPYFVSTWAKLPEGTTGRFDMIFNDALSWTETRGEFEASLAGLLGALKPGGVLVFMGAEEGGTDDPAARRRLLLDTYHREPPFRIEWSREDGPTRSTAFAVRQLGDTHFDEHHLYLVEEKPSARLEVATLRQPVSWDWPVLREMFAGAGFVSLHTRAFPGKAAGGRAIKLNVAVK